MSHNLVLSRKVGQSIGIIHDGEPMALTVLKVEGDKVRIMFTAPLSYRIVRGELIVEDGEQ